MQSKNRIAVPQTINAPISLRKVKSAVRPGVNETEVCCRHEISKREQQYVAEQQTVNWLPDDDGILAYVQQKQIINLPVNSTVDPGEVTMPNGSDT